MQNCQNSNLWKKYPTRENYQFFTLENVYLTREKISKSTRKNFWLPVKFWEKVPVKNFLYPWKKTWKGAKGNFHGFFWFSRGNKKALVLPHTYIMHCYHLCFSTGKIHLKNTHICTNLITSNIWVCVRPISKWPIWKYGGGDKISNSCWCVWWPIRHFFGVAHLTG